MGISLVERHVARRIGFREIWEGVEGWRLKVYGIAYRRPDPRPELVEAAKAIARSVLTEAAAGSSSAETYGVGFVGAHDARGGCFVFVDWWADENELHHRSFLGPSPAELRPAGPDGSVACVWDLAVIDFERRAWLETVLANPGGPDLDAYLARRLDAEV